MSNPYYTHTTYPTPNAPGSSAQLRAQLGLITVGFDKLPTLTGNGYKVAMINAAGTAIVASSSLQSLAITGSTIDNTVIGATTRAAGSFTTLSANGATNLGSAVTIAGGTIDNTIIGGTTPAAGYFTTLSVTSGLVGNLTGNVTGNLTGNVAGDVTGNLAGNVTTSTGTSTFNNVTINGTLDMSSGTVGTITGLANPTNSSDATPKSYVDTQVATRLALAGGTMSGSIAMGTNRITGMGDPSSAQDAATKAYTDAQRDTRLALAGGTMSGAIAMGTNKITGLGTPTADADAATKAYVDGVAQGLDVKASVRAATTANITLSGTATIDGVSVIAGDRVLVKDQTTASENGIWVVAAGGWGRASDMDAWAEFPGAFVFVEDGGTNDNSGWVCTVAPGGTVGSTAVTFEQFSGAGQITAGNGMTKSGNTLNVGTASSGRIVVNSDNIDLATTGVSTGTYKSVTVDAYGRVTAGTNPTTLAGYGITDAYTQTQVDTALALKLNLSGGTMSGTLAMGSNRITGLGAPVGGDDAATKTYVDTADALKLSLSGGTMSGAIAMGSNKITGLADPTLAQDAVTLNYVTTLFGSTASAAASASAAATSATNASNSATSASTSASNASTSATNAATSLFNFRAQYLGPLSSDPTLDGNGNAVTTGDLYFNTTLGQTRVYNGAAWEAAYLPSGSYVLKTGDTMTGDLGVNGSVSATSFKAGPLDPTGAYPSASVVTDSISLAQKFLAQNTVVSASLASIPTSGANYTGSPAQTYIAGNSYTSFAINGMSAGDLAKLSATQVGTSFSFMYTDGWYGSYTENRTVASVSTVGTTVTITFTQSWIPAIDVSSSNLILPYTFTYSVPTTAVTLNNATTGWITGKGTVYFTSNGTTVSVPVSDITGIGTSTITITGSYPAIAAGQSFGYLSASAMSLSARGGDGLDYTGLKFNWSTTSAMNYWSINGVRLQQKPQSVLIGTYAGSILTTTSGNTFIGDGAGQSITTGGSNTIIGNFGGISGLFDITASHGYTVLSNGAGTLHGLWTPQRVQLTYQPTPTAKTTTATLTATEVATRIITCATGTYTITLPDGAALDAGWKMPADYSIDITFIATGTGTITIAGNTGVTIVGLATLTNTQSAQFRLRKTAAATYVAYRIS